MPIICPQSYDGHPIRICNLKLLNVFLYSPQTMAISGSTTKGIFLTTVSEKDIFVQKNIKFC